MPTCWKCERELPEGQVECEDGCKPKSAQPSRGTSAPRKKPIQHELVFVDWDKVDLAALKKIIKAFCPELSVVKGSPMEIEWKEFLKE
jgi:hypothetical protein